MEIFRKIALVAATLLTLAAASGASATNLYVTLEQKSTGKYLTSLDKPLGCCMTGQSVSLESVAAPGLPQLFRVEGATCTKSSEMRLKSMYSGWANGMNVHLWKCDEANAEDVAWGFNSYDDEFGSFRLSQHPNTCLNLAGGNTSNGTNIELYDCNDSAGQQWRVSWN